MKQSKGKEKTYHRKKKKKRKEEITVREASVKHGDPEVGSSS